MFFHTSKVRNPHMDEDSESYKFKPQLFFFFANFHSSVVCCFVCCKVTNGSRGPQVWCTHLYVTSYLGQEGPDLSAQQVTKHEQMDVSWIM